MTKGLRAKIATLDLTPAESDYLDKLMDMSKAIEDNSVKYAPKCLYKGVSQVMLSRIDMEVYLSEDEEVYDSFTGVIGEFISTQEDEILDVVRYDMKDAQSQRETEAGLRYYGVGV